MENGERKISRDIAIIILSSLIITITSLFISSMKFKEGLFASYFSSPVLFLLNFLPIIMSIIIIMFIFNSLRLSIILNSILFNVLAYINYVKIIYRQEPLKFSDYKFVREALIMSKTYSLKIDYKVILMVLLFGFILYLVSKKIGVRKYNIEHRVLGIVVVATLFFIFTIRVAYNFRVYEKMGAKSGLNTWQELNGYQARGFSYPLLYTLQYRKGYIYKDYDKNNAIEIARKYGDTNIPDNEKINIVVVMLESYKDFYKFQSDKLKFNINPYEYFLKLKEESIYGDLIVDTFGGGTITSESCFWSGYRISPNYDVKRNTLVSYLKSQGYNTDALHPSDGLFNNRINIYPNVGFDNFYNVQNYFEDFYTPGDIITDDIFFPELVKIYEDKVSQNKPYFSFSITYQNHGPYINSYNVSGVEYIENMDHYDQEQYTAFNNYLDGIYKTTKALPTLVDSFRVKEEPVLLVLFGDHSPSMGEGEIGFEMLGINHNLDTRAGLLNTYETPYIIWANESCKKVFNKDFVGKGPTMDTNLLLNYVFKYLGWKGSCYSNYLQDFSENVTVTKKNFFMQKGEYVNELSAENRKRFKDLKDYEYYYSNIRVDR